MAVILEAHPFSSMTLILDQDLKLEGDLQDGGAKPEIEFDP